MKKLIITSLSIAAVATGIITYMNVSADELEAPVSNQSRIESVQLPEQKTEGIQTAPEAPQEPQAVVNESIPTEAPETTPHPSYLARDEVSVRAVQSVSKQWNPKETGVMISHSNITALIMRTYDTSPEAFTNDSIETIVTSCINRIKTINQEAALNFVSSQTCL